jgi:hypothetical protein
MRGRAMRQEVQSVKLSTCDVMKGGRCSKVAALSYLPSATLNVTQGKRRGIAQSSGDALQ